MEEKLLDEMTASFGELKEWIRTSKSKSEYRQAFIVMLRMYFKQK
jgi:hypothetical protein